MDTAGPDSGLLVVAIGGNALLCEGDTGTLDAQEDRAGAVLSHIAKLAREGRPIVVTHGNGPVVGNIVLRNEAARDRVAPMPLFIDDADSQGGIGFMLESVLRNEMTALGVDRPIACLVTQVVVDPADPAFHRPTKPIGPTFGEEEAESLARDEEWYFTQVSDSDFRRVVPSPAPLRIVELEAIRTLAEAGTVVIACGGGGVPVVESEDGMLEGIEAVIDKDLTSALLAARLGADRLVILMQADAVYVDWGTETQTALGTVTTDELRTHLEREGFDEGSIEPKVVASLTFVEDTGGEAIICRASEIEEALRGDAGTRVVRSA